ncbi:esterase [Actibacterium mucosum KCTC 23349]|uniref:Esterase n=1 Tax=Actibacterium mucosum KCTC 23349 TaxID=1454373 RepID=A0A037ZKR2_9RHOB|nr:alpha/beta fold hydrolase [Actibacterium mucosum]KAJ56142.1 esterase [Actibacterium mucosum KCTC 23349]
MLRTYVAGPETATPPLLIVHGLYGSARNWNGMAKRLSDTRKVITVDQRNHGESPWFQSHSYPDMATDLAEVIAAHGGVADVVGHSMGGKAAMTLALTQPDMVNRLVVADIAPVAYTHDQLQFIHAMRALDVETADTRSAANAQLAARIDDAGIRAFLLQSFDRKEKKWVLNLDVLEREMPNVVGWPEISGSFDAATLFLSGGASDYVLPEHRTKIRGLFPKARFAKIPGAGHWLHAEKPDAFEASLRAFLPV